LLPGERLLTLWQPSVLVNGTNPWQDKFRRMEREARRAKALQMKAEGKGAQDSMFDDFIGSSKSENKGKSGTLVDIEEVIEQNDRAEEERRRADADKIWKENEGLLSGEMV
jgi:hypothetical protein